MKHTWIPEFYEQTTCIMSFRNDYYSRYYEIKDSSKRFVDTINTTNDLRRFDLTWICVICYKFHHHKIIKESKIKT